jgi:murein DD-endopeptidase MepM/ murein hydrolase activator NlpD
VRPENTEQKSDIEVTPIDDTASSKTLDDSPVLSQENTPLEESVTIDDVQEKPLDTAEDTGNTMAKSDYIWPISNGKTKISQRFGTEGIEGGIIIDASVGTPVKSIANGVVMIAGVPSGEASAYGITVVVKHAAKKTMSIYAGLKEANVKVGQQVKQGTIIGKTGKTGTIAKKPQLYFELNDLAGKGRRSIDPEKLLPN